MKNTILENRRQAQREAELSAIKQDKGVLEAVEAIKAGTIHVQKNEDGSVQGVSVGKYITEYRYINGCLCACVGLTPEEVDEDARLKEKVSLEYKTPNHLKECAGIAAELVEAGVEVDEVIEHKGRVLMLILKERILMDRNGHTVADLSNIESKLSNKDIRTLLLEKVGIKA